MWWDFIFYFYKELEGGKQKDHQIFLFQKQKCGQGMKISNFY